MFYEYALISVVIACGYWGYFFLRHRPTGSATFGLMQVGAAALAGLGLLGGRYDEPVLGVAGAIGLGAGACLLVVGPIVRGLARRFAAAERLGVAGRLFELADLLAPGSGVAEEKAVLAAMKEIREGKIEDTVEALTAAKHRESPEARLAIDERIALLYLAAYRWPEAIAHAEAHLFGAAPPPSPPPGAAPSLRQLLGVAPPVWVELLGAYGRTGDLDRAAHMLARLEDACAERDDAALWIHRGRMMFLALAGRPAAVRALVDPRRAHHMSPAARTYWVAVAHERDGDRAAATAAYTKARGQSRGRPRELIDRALANLTDAAPAAGSPALSPLATEVVARVEAAPLPAIPAIPRPRGPWATVALTAALLGVAGVLALAVGPSSDPGTLVRGGAMVRGLVDAGEWWRLVTCVFVHVGAVHLVVNAIGMFFLGRVAEELFGSARTVALFGVAGVAGAVASYLASPAGVSAGASGAIFGLLGAVLVELTLHRGRYRTAWKRGMWGGLAVVTVAQVGVGFLYPVIDQWAHGAGLVAGSAAGALLSPHGWRPRLGLRLAQGLAVAFGAAVIAAAALAATTTIADSLDRAPRVTRVIGGVTVTAPAGWGAGTELADPDGLTIVTLHREPGAALAPALVEWIERGLPDIAKARGFDRVERADAPAIALPDGWDGRELIGSFVDALGNRQHYRMLACARAFDGAVVLAVVMTPDSIARAAPRFFTALLASVSPAD